MNVLCSAKACPVILSSSCVFYEGENLIYSGINTNDSVQLALQKLDAAIGSDVFTIGVISPLQSTGGITPILSILKSSSSIDGYLSSADWNMFNNKQNTVVLTTAGSSGASTFNSLTGALNIPDYSGAFSGFVPITRTLTINGTSYDLSANRTWNVGTVTSVGITMPSAFTVSNSPVTGAGTINVTAAGLASQYVRGDGILGDFPSNSGGGSSVSYYLNGSVNQGIFGGSTYYEMNRTPVIGGPGVNFSITNTVGLVSQFITDPLDPGLLLIPAGNWNIEFYFNASDAIGSPYFYVELYVYNGTTFTLISSGATNPEYITNGLSVDVYYTAIAVPETILTVNDRLAIRVYGSTDGARTITLHTEDDNLSQIITTFSNGLTALNGLTRQVQYFATGTTGTDFNINSSVDIHTFNLPTASASNRGALSSADWSAFNAKPSVNLYTGDGTLTGNRIVTMGAYSLLFEKDIYVNALTVGRGGDNEATNTAFGKDALYLNTGGFNNSAIGFNSLRSNSLGYANTAFGYYSLYSNVIAYGNTAIGNYSLYANLGFRNTAVGDESLIYNNTGSSNTAIGYNAGGSGYMANTNTTGSNNIFIGYISIGESPTESNRTWIGNTSTQSTWVGGNLLVGTRVNGIYKLDVSGTARVSGEITASSGMQWSNGSGLLQTNAVGGVSLLIYQHQIQLDSGQGNAIYFDPGTSSSPFSKIYSNSLPLCINGSGLKPETVFGLDTATANSSSIVRIESTTRGFLPPRMTTTQRDAIATPATGLQIYNTTTNANNYYDGSAWVAQQSAITNPVTGTGTANYITKWTSASGIGNSLVYDNGTNVGINTIDAEAKLHVNGNLFIGGIATIGLQLENALTAIPSSNVRSMIANTQSSIVVAGALLFQPRTGVGAPILFSTEGSEKMRLSSTGNLLLNSTTDNGNRLQVTGNGYFSGNVGIGTATTNGKLQVKSGTNQNLVIGTQGGELSFEVVNDAYTVNTPVRYYASTHNWYTGGNIKAILDPSGNLGLGVTPSAWASDWKTVQVGSRSAFSQYANGAFLTNNLYFDTISGGSSRYIGNGFANIYQQSGGSHIWYNAPSGIGGNVITLTQAMTLDASGRLGIGTASPGSKLFINTGGIGTTANGIGMDNGAQQHFWYLSDNTTSAFSIGSSLGVFKWENSNGERMRITSGGNLLVGTTTDSGERLVVSGAAKVSGDLTISKATDNVKLNLFNTTAPNGKAWYIDSYSNGSLYFGNAGGNYFYIASTGAATFSSSVQTGTPTGGTARPWKLGQYNATAPTATGYVEVEINGVLYKLIAAT